MSVDKFTKEELNEMSLIEIAYELLNGAKTPYSFNEIVKEVSRLVDLSEDQINDRLAQFYTDINIDGRFLSLGDNRWGLRTWYPVDKSEEDVVTVTKPKKKKAKKAAEDDFDDYDDSVEEDYEEFDEDDDVEDEDDLLDDDLADDEEEDDDSFDEDAEDSFEIDEDELDEDLDEEDDEEDEDEFEDEDEEDK
ncbi:DNA-directed RNA polymerase subunit delta [Niallia circulans]|uniref:Probable DNA-directed RNA polymerase subunit delta n=1 Tax=Niallia circulans TaxID=1397 RepID=A0A553SI63_NIACI|nr:DNA-directed RNA polymerase subunit delta [Niallia circulans]TRZ36675.1 DNA-directed RNA polymerase subunit delta [Niallia circulans]